MRYIIVEDFNGEIELARDTEGKTLVIYDRGIAEEVAKADYQNGIVVELE